MATLVKVCGITSPQDGRAAAAAGAAATGLVFWARSPRAVDLRTAREIANSLPPFVLRVGVFVDEAPRVMARIADSVGLDLGGFSANPPSGPAACPRSTGSGVGVLQGTRTYLLQDKAGNVLPTHSVSAGLDYPAVGPEHALLHDEGRVRCAAVSDDAALAAFHLLSETEGLIPALEEHPEGDLSARVRWLRGAS